MNSSTFTVTVIIISGRSGSGKSSTTYEAAHILQQRNIIHLTIEADHLDTLYPRSNSPEIMLQNLKAIWSTYWRQVRALRDATVQSRLVVLLNGTGIIMNMNRILSAVQEVVSSSPAANESEVVVQMVPVILKAGEDTVEGRLGAREIGSELEAHLISTRRMDGVLADWAQLQTRKIHEIVSEGCDVVDVARNVLQAAGLE